MKSNFVQSMLALLCMLMLPAAAWAYYDFSRNGIYYEIVGNDEVGVTYNTIGGTLNNPDYQGNIVIPETVSNGGKVYRVTRILNQAFYYTSGMTSLKIPKSVVSIDKNVMVGCSGLNSIIVDENNPVYDSRDNCNAIIETASNSLIKGCNTTVIPDGVKTIKMYAFHYCKTLTTLNVPASVTRIETQAIYYAPELKTLSIPASVTSIEDNAIYNCNSLKTITVAEGNPVYDSREGCNAVIQTATNRLVVGGINTVIPGTVTAIADGAFSGRRNMTSINFPASLTSIGVSAFWACVGLTEVTIPEQVGKISKQAFYNCTSLTLVHMAGSAVTDIDNEAFSGCTALTEVRFSPCLQRIGEKAFYGCTSLETLDFPETLEYIGGQAFSNTAWLTNLPDGLNYVGNVLLTYRGTMPDSAYISIREGTQTIVSYAFSGKSTMVGIDMPNSLKKIGNYAFRGCSALNDIQWSESLEEIENNAFEDCDALTQAVLPNSLKKLGDRAFYSCDNLTDLTIGASLDSIDYGMFYYDRALANISVDPGNATYDSRNGCNAVIETATGTLVMGAVNTVIPQGVTAIGNRAFYLSNLESIVIPNTVTSIGKFSFYDCPSLKSIDIPNSVKSIGASAFYSCDSLTQVVIPNSVTSLGEGAFRYCKALTNVVLSEALTSIEASAFSSCKQLASIVIPPRVRSIGRSAFSECSLLVDVVFPDSLESIGIDAFKWTKWYGNLPSGISFAGPVLYCYKGDTEDGAVITVPEGTLGIAAEAFKSKTIGRVELPSSLRVIGDYAFAYCRQLTEVDLSGHVTTIGDYAFSSCNALKRVYLGPATTSIGVKAFLYSFNMESITCTATKLPTIDSTYPDTYSFYGMKLYVPEPMVDAYKAADGWCNFAYILPITIGDANSDGELDINDVIGIIDRLLEGKYIDPAVADVNGDGEVDINDITALIDMLLNA